MPAQEHSPKYTTKNHDLGDIRSSKFSIARTIQMDPYPPCAISNVVSYMYLNMKQNQKKIALYAKDKLPLFFDPRIFPSSQQQFKVKGYPVVKILFFSKKSHTIGGGVSEDHNRLIAWSAVKYMRKKFNIDLRIDLLLTRNIVAYVYMTFRINLEAMHTKMRGRSEFKPECIDCCRIKSKYGKPRVFLIFRTGSILLVGSKSEQELAEIYEEACELAFSFKSTEKNTKATSRQKLKRKFLHEDSIRSTNIEIETAMGMKRRKVTRNTKNGLLNELNLEMFDDMYDFESSASTAYLQMMKKESEKEKNNEPEIFPGYSPGASTYTIESPNKLSIEE